MAGIAGDAVQPASYLRLHVLARRSGAFFLTGSDVCAHLSELLFNRSGITLQSNSCSASGEVSIVPRQ